MKKHFIITSALMALFMMASCSEEDMPQGQVNGDFVTFKVAVPQISTRAISDGYTANRLYWGVYDHNGRLLPEISNTDNDRKDDMVFSGSGEVKLTLAQDKKYSIVFWAANESNSMCHVDWDGRCLSVEPKEANQESYDAFCAYVKIDNVSGYKTQEVKLYRPFAQLNIGTADYAKAAASGLTVKNTRIKVSGIPVQYNFVDSTTVGDRTMVYDYPEKPVSFKDEKYPVNGYEYLAMNYILVGSDKELVTVKLSYLDDDRQEHERTYTAVPVQRNWRTNIYGNILTSETDFTVTIMPGFDGNDNIKVWDGKSTDIPVIDDVAKTVTIVTGNQLAWLAAYVNGTLNANTRSASNEVSLDKSYTIVLDENIDLGGEEWTPIGYGKHFEFSFDGKGHTISNFKITKKEGEKNNAAALFGSIAGTTTLKDFTVKNAQVIYPGKEIEDFYGAAIVGTVYGSHTFENIYVTNSTIQGNNKVAGLIAHDGSSSKIEINNCHVSGCTIETKNEEDGGNVAGMVGYIQTKNVVISNSSVKNCVINAINSSDTGKRANSQFVGAIKGDGNLTIANCVVENNTYNESGLETYQTPYDGIFVGGAREEATAIVVINGKPYGGLKLSDKFYKTVDEALAEAKAGDVIYVGAGTFVIPYGVTTSPAGTITFEGYGNSSVLSFNTKAGGADGGLNSYAHGMDLVFKNLKVVSPNTGSAYSGGFGYAKSVIFEGCTYEGQYRSIGNTKFEGCTINPQNSYIYTDRVNVNFIDCTFNCSEGKGIQVYGDNSGWESVINVTDCEFTAAKVGNTWDGKPVTAIDINSTGAKFTVNITNSTATGFGKGLFSNSQLWNIKGGEANVTVTIDNNVAYPFFTQDETTGEYNVTTAQGIKDVLTLAGAAGAGSTTINIATDIDLNGVEWTPIKVDGYNGADIVKVNGNGKTITGLTGGLFAGGFAGGSGIVIENLTIANSTIIANNTQGYGAFVGCADAMDEITLTNCHLTNSTIITPNDGADESRIGGLIGWTAGYNVQNDGPVDSHITVTRCSVKGCTLKGAGSIGGIVGHAGANAATFTTIENCTVTDNNLISTDAGAWRVGVVVGTANNGQCVINNITESNNTLSQTGKTAPAGQSNLYGRFVPVGTGTLVIDGVSL